MSIKFANDTEHGGRKAKTVSGVTDTAGAPLAGAGPTVIALAGDLFDDSSTVRTMFSFSALANTNYVLEGIITAAGDSSNIGILVGLNLPSGATSTITIMGPVADNNVLVQGTANNSGNFAGTGNWIGGNTKAMVHIKASVIVGATAGTVAVQFVKNGSGTVRVYKPSILSVYKA